MYLTDARGLEGYGYTVQWYLTDIAKYLALWSISKASEKHGFTYVLGGGTALNDIYFPRHRRRFSRDLDLYLVNINPNEFLTRVNEILEQSRYYQVLNVVGAKVVVQGLVYEGVRRNNVIYKFRLKLPSIFHSGLKLADILPSEIKRRKEFNRWYMKNKENLPRIYEIEVAIFRGERRYAHPLQNRVYELPVRSITDWINLPSPCQITVFSLEDLLASKIEGIISGLVARRIIPGKVTGRRTVKVRDVYDVVVAFLEELYSKEKLLKSLEALKIDLRYALKAIRLAMLQTVIDPNKYREITELIPSMRGKLRDWISMVLEAYEKTLALYEHTPEDYIAYKLVLGEKVSSSEVKRRFDISNAQLSHILSMLEEMGFQVTNFTSLRRKHNIKS